VVDFNSGTRLFYVRPSDGLTYCFEPVPLLAETREYLKTADDRLGTVTTLTFNGYLLPNNPALSGVQSNVSCIELLDRKSDQLDFALSEDYGDLLVVDGTGYPVIVGKPRVVSLSFPESQIVNHRQYTVIFEIEENFSINQRVRDYTETWSFSQEQDDTVSVNHTVNAVGFSEPSQSKTAVQNAKDFVLTKVGLNKNNASFIQVPYVQAMVSVDALGSFNHVLAETSDITAGSYDITETWILASGNYKDDRTIEHTWELDANAILVETLNINGVVQGYGDTTFDKFTNASNGFDNTVVAEIDFNVSDGISSKNKSENRFAGTIQYSIVTVPSGDDIEGRSIQRSIERREDGSVIQTVTTSAQVRRGSSATINVASDYCFANNYPIDSATPIFDASLSGNLLSVGVNRDDALKSFSLTRAFVDQTTSLWSETYEVQRQEQVDSSETVISINGTIVGMGEETGTKSDVRFVNASGAYYTVVEPLILSRINPIIPTGSCILDEPASQSFGYNIFNGTITYGRTFSSRFLTDNEYITKEEIDINFVLPVSVISVIQIPGKADGPILQDQETVGGKQKQLTINYTMRSQTSQCTRDTTTNNALIDIALTESNIVINNTPTENAKGEKPESAKVFKIGDTYGFNRQSNVFTRNVTWQYL